MALPKLTIMKHELSLPSTGEKITYRPFLVKEEKILMMAMQGGKASDMVKALREIIQNCIENDNLTIDTLPMFDVEYIFLQLRGRSIGEDIDIQYQLPDHVCEKGGDCDYVTKINVDEIEIVKNKEHKALIDITDDIKVNMRYPKIEMGAAMADLGEADMVETTFDMIGDCIEYIMDGEEIHKTIDYTKEEVNTFLNSLSSKQFKNMQGFFETMPKLQKKITAECNKCGKKNERVLEGLTDFFALG